MDFQQEKEDLKRSNLLVIPLRDCRNILLPEVKQIYGMCFDDEPVILFLAA